VRNSYFTEHLAAYVGCLRTVLGPLKSELY